jgi:hypothetical protein
MVPLSDVKYLLNLYNIKEEENIYLQCWNFIISNDNILVPQSIADWIIAYNNLDKKDTIIYRYPFEIIFTSLNELRKLELGTTDKERIIRILSYMNILNNNVEILDVLPFDVFKNIVSNLSCSELMVLCKISKKLNKFCFLNLDTLLKNILEKKLLLDLQRYNNQTLSFLCKIRNNNRLSGGFSKYYTLNYDGTIEGIDIKNIVSISGGDDNFMLLDCNGNVINSKLEYENIKKVVQVSVGYNHYIFLRYDGYVYIKGKSDYGQLGVKNRNVENIIRNPFLQDVIQISTYSNHSLALRSDGRVYSFGNNKYGQLGYISGGTNEYYPMIIPDLDDVVQISVGNGFSLVLKSDGTVYGFGDNKYNQLGLKETTVKYPTKIPHLENIVKISAGNTHFITLDKYGNVNNLMNNVEDVFAGNKYSLLLTKEGKIIYIDNT